MDAKEIVEWVDKNTWGSDWEEGERCSYQTTDITRLVNAAFDCVPQGGRILEIGVYGGRSLGALLCVARELNAEVWAADPFVVIGDVAEPHMKKTVAMFPDVNLRFFRMTSEEARKKVKGERFDLIHIDGDHLNAALDCELWLPLLRSGGIAVLHDMVNDPRSPVYEGGYLGAKPYVEDWELLWWAEDEEGHQMGRRKP